MGQKISKTSKTKIVPIENKFCATAYSRPDILDTFTLLNIPQEVRVKILSLLCSKDKQTLRLVCRQLSTEIDLLVGPSDYLPLYDSQCKKALKFHTKCFISAIKISQPYIYSSTPFHSTISHPSRIKSVQFTKFGVITPSFATEVLLKCTNLTKLNWSGTIKGLLNPYGPEIYLPHLKSLQLNSNNMLSYSMDSHLNVFLNVINGLPFDLNSVMTFWHNQLSLIRRITCPQLKETRLFLYTCENAELKDSDEAELIKEVSSFLNRHPDLHTLKLYHAQRQIDPHLEYQHPLSFFNKSFRPLQNHGINAASIPRSTLNICKIFRPDLMLKSVLFCSRLNYQFDHELLRNFETYVLDLLKSLRHLESLKFSGTKGRPQFWCRIETILHQNFRTLCHLELVGKIEGPIDFGVMAELQNLRVIRLNNKQKYRHASLSPVILNFGPHPSMVDNLETLILQNIGLTSIDFESLSKLRRLKHLGIYRWRCGPGEQNLTFEGIKKVLEIKSLEALLIPWPRFSFDKGISETEREWIQRVSLVKLRGYLHPKEARKLGLLQYLCVDETKERLWRRTEWGFKIFNSFKQRSVNF